MAVAFVWRSPIVPTDPYHYVLQTLEFPSDNWVALGLSRYGIFLANIPPAFLFKNAEATYYFWPLLSTGILAAMVYLIGRRFWGVVAGLVAVVVLFSNTVVFYNLTRFYPDVMAIAIIYSAAFAALRARDRDFRGRSGVVWLLLTGFLLGWSFEVRETAMLSFPLVMLLLWRRGSVLRAFGTVAVTVGLWLMVDVGISWFVYGDPLLKAHILVGENPAGAGYPPPIRPPSPGPAVPLEFSRWDRFLTIPRTALETRPDGIWVVVTGIIASLAAAARNLPLRRISLGLLAVYGLNLLAGGLLLPERPFGDLSNSRYWIQFFPAVALAMGGVTAIAVRWCADRWALTTRSKRGIATGILAAAVCTVPVFHAQQFMTNTPSFAPNGGDALEKLRDYASETGFAPETVWTDTRTLRLLPVFQRASFGGSKVWTGEGRALTKNSEPHSGDAVLFYSAHDPAVCVHCNLNIQGWLSEHPTVPSGWELVFSTPDKTIELYRVR
ncbi:MAG: glycosyltransferase family 39 protein [Ornithinibacter sp.]